MEATGGAARSSLQHHRRNRHLTQDDLGNGLRRESGHSFCAPSVENYGSRRAIAVILSGAILPAERRILFQRHLRGERALRLTIGLFVP
jgi:hypothetical protein